MWLMIKRALILLVGIAVTIIGIGVSVSSFFDPYNYQWWHTVIVAGLGVLLAALGVFFLWIGIRGSDKMVSDTDLS